MTIDLDLILLDASFLTADAAIKEVGRILIERGYIQQQYVASMLQRNQEASVYLGNFVAMPHGKVGSEAYVRKDAVVLVQVPDGINFGSEGKSQIVTLLFFVVMSQRSISLMQNIAFLCSDMENIIQLSTATTEERIREIIRQA